AASAGLPTHRASRRPAPAGARCSPECAGPRLAPRICRWRTPGKPARWLPGKPTPSTMSAGPAGQPPRSRPGAGRRQAGLRDLLRARVYAWRAEIVRLAGLGLESAFPAGRHAVPYVGLRDTLWCGVAIIGNRREPSRGAWPAAAAAREM